MREDLKGDTESKIIAAQDQALQTKYLATEILQTLIENVDFVNSLM
jgi:hypothetical protein